VILLSSTVNSIAHSALQLRQKDFTLFGMSCAALVTRYKESGYPQFGKLTRDFFHGAHPSPITV